MNWRRGLFRLWIVGAAIFAIAVSCVSYGEIDDPGAAAVGGAKRAMPSEQASKPTSAELERRLPKQRLLSDEEVGLKPVTDPALLARIKGYVSPNPWGKVGFWASIAFGIPLAVLILGASLVWAFSGFAVTRP